MGTRAAIASDVVVLVAVAVIGDVRVWTSPRRSRGNCGSMTFVLAVELIFAFGWVAFWMYWLAAAFSMRKGRASRSGQLRIQVVVIAASILLLRTCFFHDNGTNTDPGRAAVGLLFFALGLGFAIWARLHIGRNWGMPMTKKDEPELVTSGPYRLARHPIYSGILLAGIGTAVALDWSWLIANALVGIYFVYSATAEERYLTEQFPIAYPMYKRSTKMLVPFIF